MTASALVLALVAIGAPLPAGAAATGPCRPGATANTTVQVTTPVSKARVDLASTPRVDVKGWLRQSGRDPVVRVDVYGDTRLLGQASVSAVGSGPTRADQAWAFPTFVPTGERRLTACAVSASGAVAGAAVVFTAVAPPPDATVLAPDVKVVESADLSRVTASDSSQVTFSGSVPFVAGDILLAPSSATTPAGLMARVTRARALGSTTVLTTTPVGLDQVVLQAKVDAQDIPLRAAAPLPAGSFGAASLAPLEPLVWSARVWGEEPNAQFSADASVTLDTRVDFGLDIQTRWDWWRPTVELKQFSFSTTGSATAQIKGNAGMNWDWYKPNVFGPLRLPPIPIAASPFPLTLTPTVGLDTSAAASLEGEFDFSSTLSLTSGFRLLDGQFQDLTSADANGTAGVTRSSTAVLGVEANVEAAIVPWLTTGVNGIDGVTVHLPVGGYATATVSNTAPPCLEYGLFYGPIRLKAQLGFLGFDVVDQEWTPIERRPTRLSPECPTAPAPPPPPPTDSGGDNGTGGDGTGSGGTGTDDPTTPPPPAPPATPAQTVDGITLASRGWDDQKPNRDVHVPVAAANGRFVAFLSRATNLGPGGADAGSSATTTPPLAAYVKDVVTGEIRRVSTFADGSDMGEIHAVASGSGGISLSADGQRVALSVRSDIYVKDVPSGTVTCASCSLEAPSPDLRDARSPAISADGNVVAFEWTVHNDNWNLRVPKIFSMDLRTGLVTMVSGSEVGTSAYAPAVDASGSRVAFVTKERLLPSDTNDYSDVYVRDLSNGLLHLASVGAKGESGNNDSLEPSIAGDRVAFHTRASSLRPDDLTDIDVYVKDLSSGELMLASLPDGQAGGSYNDAYAEALDPVLSSDGTRVAFSALSALHPSDRNGQSDVYVRDLQTNTTTLVSATPSGVSSNGGSGNVSVSGDAVAFLSDATDLHPGDTDTTYDIFVTTYRRAW